MVALIIEGSDHANHQITVTFISPGHPKYQDAYRSKLAGIFHVAYIVEEISREFNILEGAITIVCDGLNAIKNAMDRATRYSCVSNHFDLI